MSIVEKRETNVKSQQQIAEEQPQNNNWIDEQNCNREKNSDEPTVEEIPLESTDSTQSGAFNRGFRHQKLAKKIQDLKAKTSFRLLLESDGHKVEQSSGGRYVCRCPFHNDSTPSFTIYNDISAYCFGCDKSWDVFKYEMEYHHVTFKVAWNRLKGALPRIKRPRGAYKPDPENKEIKAPELSNKQKVEIQRYTTRLGSDLELCQRIADRRIGDGEKWKPDTLQQLTIEGCLGWAGDALAFIYPTGIKYRNWPNKGPDDLKWDCDGLSLWRQYRLDCCETIYLTESETDAISLIDCAIEQIPGVGVIAVPSATSFNNSWAPLFSGKTVIDCFDNDETGRKEALKLKELLLPYVVAYKSFWKEVS